MTAPGHDGAVRSHGSRDTGPIPPGRRMLVVVLFTVVGAVAITYLGADPATESERSAITSPTVVDEPSTTVADGVVVPDAPIPDPLDDHIDGFRGTLVMTVGTAAGMETWRWSSGPDGVLVKSAPVPDVYDARPDPSGREVAAVRRFGREQPSLRVGSQGEMFPVFWGTQSFEWHRSDAGAIAWVAQSGLQESPTLHAGRWIGDGVYFKPVAVLDRYDLLPRSRQPDRLVGYDDQGFVFERRGEGGTLIVERLDPSGRLLSSVAGAFVALSPDGEVAIAHSPTTGLKAGPDLDRRSDLSAAYSSLAWAEDGRIAATHFESDAIDIIDGAAVRSVSVGAIQPAILTWSADGRFVLASGHAGGEALLVFIDSASLDVTTLVLAGHPIAAVALP